MRILIISPFFPPQNSIAGQRPYSWAKYWSGMGNQVDVLTTPKAENESKGLFSGFRVVEIPYPFWYEKLWALYLSLFPRKKIDGAVAGSGVSAHPLIPEKTKSRIYDLLKRINEKRLHWGIFGEARMPSFADFWVPNALSWMKENKGWDLVVSTSWPYATHILGFLAKRKGWAKTWNADFRDLWVGNHISQGIFPFRGLERLLERKLLSGADTITTVSPPLADWLRNSHQKPVFVVENGFEAADWQNLPDQKIFQNDGKCRLVYAGTIYPGKRDPSPLFQAIYELKSDPIRRKLLERLEVIFVGQNVEPVSELVEKYQVAETVKCLGLVSRPDALRMQRDATVLLFLEDTSQRVEGIFTGKLFEYFSSGTHFWAIGVGKNSALGRLIDQSCAGEVLEKNVPAIKERLWELLNLIEKRIQKLPEGFLQGYSRQSLAEKMLREICERLSSRPSPGSDERKDQSGG